MGKITKISKTKDKTAVRQDVMYPKFKTLEEQRAFQWGLAIAFNANAECANATSTAIIKKGEEILKEMGWDGKMGGER